MTKTHFTITGQAPLGEPHIPFAERPVCSIADAAEATGLSRSKIYDLMQGGAIEWVKVGARRLIRVPSLLRFLEATPSRPDDPYSPSEGSSSAEQSAP
jgi:excisionase family DNA binding protein